MIEILVIIGCLALNVVLAGAEMAFVSANRASIRQAARQGNPKAQTLLSLRDRPERTLAVIQIGITLVGSVAGATGGAGAEEWLSPQFARFFGLSAALSDVLAITVVVLPLTYGTVVIGELFPKSVALRNALKMSLFVTPALHFADRWLGPIVSLLERSSNLLVRLCVPCRKHAEVTSPDLEPTIQLSSLSSQHRQYVLNLVDLERKRLKEVMLPWAQAVCVDKHMTGREVEDIVIRARHTRLPVTEGQMVVGILNTKEFIALRSLDGVSWLTLVRTPAIMSENLSLLQGLKLLQELRMHLGIVCRESRPVGIVTLEDILEEVIGDIYDEDDDDRLKILAATLKTRGFSTVLSKTSQVRDSWHVT